MKDDSRPPIAELIGDPRIIETAVRRAAREAVLAQARLGLPVATWRGGQVVWLQPAEVLAALQDGTTTGAPGEELP